MNPNMRSFALVALLLSALPLGCEAGGGPSGGSASAAERVDGARAKQLVAAGATLLDVRSAGEFADGHAPGATNIPVEELDARVRELDSERPVVTYCAVGARSRVAARLLGARGFTVYDLGSLSAWPR
jgi:rhodanese-related sulfurtransferase